MNRDKITFLTPQTPAKKTYRIEHVSSLWCIAGIPNGGWLTSLSAKAADLFMNENVFDGHHVPLSVNTHFLAP
jgi:hypothetical protein